MNKYRTHNCNELRKDDLDKDISISGWINKKRDHGNLLFIDLRDNGSDSVENAKIEIDFFFKD